MVLGSDSGNLKLYACDISTHSLDNRARTVIMVKSIFLFVISLILAWIPPAIEFNSTFLESFQVPNGSRLNQKQTAVDRLQLHRHRRRGRKWKIIKLCFNLSRFVIVVLAAGLRGASFERLAPDLSALIAYRFGGQCRGAREWSHFPWRNREKRFPRTISWPCLCAELEKIAPKMAIPKGSRNIFN